MDLNNEFEMVTVVFVKQWKIELEKLLLVKRCVAAFGR